MWLILIWFDADHSSLPPVCTAQCSHRQLWYNELWYNTLSISPVCTGFFLLRPASVASLRAFLTFSSNTAVHKCCWDMPWSLHTATYVVRAVFFVFFLPLNVSFPPLHANKEFLCQHEPVACNQAFELWIFSAVITKKTSEGVWTWCCCRICAPSLTQKERHSPTPYRIDNLWILSILQSLIIQPRSPTRVSGLISTKTQLTPRYQYSPK